MTNTEIVNAIFENIVNILANYPFDYQMEETGRGIDPASKDPVCQMYYAGEKFEYTHGERPKYSLINITLEIAFNNYTLQEARTLTVDHVHKLREALTVNALNVDLLETLKLVTRVDSQDVIVTYEKPKAKIEYQVQVKYREQ